MNDKELSWMGGSMLIANERGAVAVMVAVTLPVLLGFAALTIDIGQALVAKNELQDVADAGALAGARRLGTIYQGLSPVQQVGYTMTDPVPVYSEVQNVASQNYAAGQSIAVDVADIQIGQWDSSSKTLTITAASPNAIRVTARRDGNTNGPVSTFLASFMGINSIDIRATATAALTGVSTTNPGELETPFGISEFRFNDPAYCNAPIRFYPTNDPASCGGWHTFTENPPNANTLRNVIDGMIPEPPTYTSPATQAGVTGLEFVGGNIANALNNLYNLYLSKRDSATGFWDALVPVYQSGDCSNPNTAMTIIGYASVRITNVLAPPAGQLVDATIQCGLVDGGRGGGSSFGTLGSIPGIVQ
jgi:Flp pilus assembly protein TadG